MHETIWTYDVRPESPAARGDELALAVDAVFAAGGSDAFGVDEEAAPFVRGVEYAARASDFRPALREGTHWTAPCRAAGCRVRYRFALTEAAATIDDPSVAGTAGGAVVAPPSTWLLRPLLPEGSAAMEGLFRFRVRAQPGIRFAIGTAPAPGGAPDEFEAATKTLESASFAVFGALRLAAVESGPSRVDVAMAPRGLTLPEADTLAWIGRSVAGLADYYGHFPVKRTLIIVVPGKHGETNGVTLGEGGPSVLLSVPAALTATATRDDWVVTHELLHVTQPFLGRPHAWLEEGMATYVEPIVRARAGLVTVEKFWRDLVEGLPQGLPRAGDLGLERTRTWGRTYWGGALFWLVADLRIRERTRDRRLIDDVLRGAVATGADVETHWSIERFLDAGDRATQTGVLHELYREMALAPGGVDLDALWSRLGVHADRSGVSFDDAAPLAPLRRAITARATRTD